MERAGRGWGEGVFGGGRGGGLHRVVELSLFWFSQNNMPAEMFI